MPPGRVAAVGDEPLEPADVCLDDGGMALEREDQRDVDRASRRDAVLDCTETRLGPRNLHEDIGAIDELVQPHGLLVRRVAIVGDVGIDLDGHVAVDPTAVLPRPVQDVAGSSHVFGGEVDEDLLRIGVAAQHVSELVVVPASGRERLLEDRGIRCHSDDRVLFDQPRELARLEHLSGERVDPDAHAVLRELMESAPSHSVQVTARRQRETAS